MWGLLSNFVISFAFVILSQIENHCVCNNNSTVFTLDLVFSAVFSGKSRNAPPIFFEEAFSDILKNGCGGDYTGPRNDNTTSALKHSWSFTLSLCSRKLARTVENTLKVVTPFWYDQLLNNSEARTVGSVRSWRPNSSSGVSCPLSVYWNRLSYSCEHTGDRWKRYPTCDDIIFCQILTFNCTLSSELVGNFGNFRKRSCGLKPIFGKWSEFFVVISIYMYRGDFM